jgi:lipoyl(octanoyl) transferase
MRELEVTNLGTVEYKDGLDLQDDLRRAVTDGRLPDQLLLLEHPPVVTFGRRADHQNLVASPEDLGARGIELHPTGRGGDVTFHGPGQLVGYPVMDLNPDRRDVHRYVRDLEEVIIRTLGDFGVGAGRISGLTGVWIGDLKIAAIGVRISRWVTTHGFAFNIATDLDSFRVIIPCGIPDRGVTSLSRILGRTITIDEVRPHLTGRFAEVFGRRLRRREIASRTVQVWIWSQEGDETKVLVLKRSASRGGFWQPVTGAVEAGEAPVEAAAREVAEETGLRGELRGLGYERDFRIDPELLTDEGGIRPKINRETAFALRVESDSVRLSPQEHDEYQWVAPDHAKELLRWNGNRKALERLERQLPA